MPLRIDDSPEILSVINSIGEIAESEGVRCALVGPLAMQIHGLTDIRTYCDYVPQIVVESPLRGLRVQWHAACVFGTHVYVYCVKEREDGACPADHMLAVLDGATFLDSRVDKMKISSPSDLCAFDYVVQAREVHEGSDDYSNVVQYIKKNLVDRDLVRRNIELWLGKYGAADFDRECSL